MVIWRNTAPTSLAAWGNTPLKDRVLDLLADMLFATDELREMLAAEEALDRLSGLDDRLSQIDREVACAMREVEEAAER